VLDVKTMLMRHTVITKNADENNSRPMSLASDYELTREDRLERDVRRSVKDQLDDYDVSSRPLFERYHDCQRPGGVHPVQSQCCMLIPVC